MGFEPPGPEQRLEAIGPTKGLSVVLQRAFAPDDNFPPIPIPGQSDWLAVHQEPGQTFEEFRRSQPNRPDAQRRIIYLQPLGAFLEEQSPSLEKLREYAADFFQMEVKALAPVGISSGGFTSRTNSLAGRRHHLPEDALHYSESLPAGESATVVGDLDELKAAVSNLLDNAIKYSGTQISVLVELAKPDSKRVAIRVTDEGVGISNEELKRIFKRFYRIPGAVAMRVKGTGLGLSISHRIITQHGGDIEAASPGPNQGSTFTVRVPLQPAESAAEEAAIRAAA